jgi:hypothetical protein
VTAASAADPLSTIQLLDAAMTLISHPGSWNQTALAAIDAGVARDIALMLAGARAVLDRLASGSAPQAASQAAAIPGDTESPYTLQGLARAVAEAGTRLRQAVRDALAGIPDHIPGS